MNQTQISVNHRQIGYRIKEVREQNHISQAVPRRIIVLTYRSHTADYHRHIPSHVSLNVLCFTARFFLFILTIPALIRIVFHVTKKRERTAPTTVRSFSHLMCVPQAVP